jgi:hypothetical protein
MPFSEGARDATTAPIAPSPFAHSPQPLSGLDLAEGRLRLGPGPQRQRRAFFPWLSGRPSAPFLARQQSPPWPSSAPLRPLRGAASGRLRPVDHPSRPRWSGLEDQTQGDPPWRPSAPSRRPATSSPARSSPSPCRPRRSASSPRRTARATASTHRVFVGQAEIGAGWTKTSREGRAYLGLKLDDPSFAAPVFANLLADEDGTHRLIWSRPSDRRED